MSYDDRVCFMVYILFKAIDSLLFFLLPVKQNKSIRSRDFSWLVVLGFFWGRRSGPASMLHMVVTGKYHSLGHRLMEVNSWVPVP